MTSKLAKLANNMTSYSGRFRWYVGEETGKGTRPMSGRWTMSSHEFLSRAWRNGKIRTPTMMTRRRFYPNSLGGEDLFESLARNEPEGDRSRLPIPEDVWDRARDEAVPLAIDERDVADARDRVDAVRERALRERLNDCGGFLREFGRGQTRDPVDHDPAPVDPGAVLGRPVEAALVKERRPRGPRGAHVRLHRIQRVGLP